DTGKFPQVQGNKFIAYDYPTSKLLPTVVDGSFTDYGYSALADGSQNAFLFNAIAGQDIVSDFYYVFKPTKTGSQTLAFDQHGVLPQEMYLRFYMLLGTDFYVPDHSQCNGAKWALGFHH